ncbi:MAG: hypothetical protein Q4B13_10805 [Lautropia sp.]|nr:hypothetical protein [Lautropia sp.]
MSDVPIDLVEEALGISPGDERLFDVFIQIHAKNKLNGVLSGPQGEPISFRQIDPDKHESMLGLQFEVMEERVDGVEFIRILMSYRGSAYSAADVARIRAAVCEIFDVFSQEGAAHRKLSTLKACPGGVQYWRPLGANPVVSSVMLEAPYHYDSRNHLLFNS